MTLADRIARWDTKDTTPLRRAYAAFSAHPRFHHDLIALFSSTEHQDGATWLFKHAIDEQALVPEAIDQKLVTAICKTLKDLESWPAQLHVLQILSLLPIPSASAGKAEAFARACMISETKFVRAWSYSALSAATRHDAKKHKQVLALLNEKLEDPGEPASVKARIRNTIRSR